MKNGNLELKNRIRKIRENLGIDQGAFGVLIGNKSRSAVCKYENGDSEPPIETLRLIAEVGAVTIDWLITGREPEAPIISETNEKYLPGSKTEEEIMNDHLEQVIELLEKQGVERVIAEKMLEATIREAKITGTGPDGYINLGDFLKDAKRRGEKEAAHQRQAAEEDS